MDTNITRDVTDLVENDRQSLEHLLGTELSAAQKVCIVAFTPGKGPIDTQMRDQAADRIEQVLDSSAAYAQVHGMSDAEIDEAVDAAMDDIRQRETG